MKLTHLSQVFNGVDVVMRRGADEANTRDRLASLSNMFRNLSRSISKNTWTIVETGNECRACTRWTVTVVYNHWVLNQVIPSTQWPKFKIEKDFFLFFNNKRQMAQMNVLPSSFHLNGHTQGFNHGQESWTKSNCLEVWLQEWKDWLMKWAKLVLTGW